MPKVSLLSGLKQYPIKPFYIYYFILITIALNVIIEEKAKSSLLWIPLWRCEGGTWSYDLMLGMAEWITSKVVSKHNDIILEAGTFCELVIKVC